MPFEVILPKVDMDMSHGTVSAWHVEEGAEVKVGQPLFDIETDKAAMEVESTDSGRIHHLTPPGTKVAVGLPVAWIYAAGEEVGPPPAVTAAPAEAAPAAAAPKSAPAPAAAAAPAARAAAPLPSEGPQITRATPAARKAARDAGIDVAHIGGSGPRGRVQRADVATAVAQLASRPGFGAEAGWSPQPGALRWSLRPGQGTPVVLIHGFASEAAAWMPLERALPAHLALARLDLPNHGQSPRRRLTAFAELAKMVTEAFDQQFGEQEVHLVGHSLGGGLALALADIRPRQVKSLTLMAPAGLGPEIDAASLEGISRAGQAESLGPWLRRLTADPDAISDSYLRAAMASRRDPELRAAQRDMSRILFPDGTQGFDLRAALGRLTAPSTLIWGREDHIIPWRQALAAPAEMALHLLPRVGHMPYFESPDLVARLLLRQFAAAG